MRASVGRSITERTSIGGDVSERLEDKKAYTQAGGQHNKLFVSIKGVRQRSDDGGENSDESLKTQTQAKILRYLIVVRVGNCVRHCAEQSQWGRKPSLYQTWSRLLRWRPAKQSFLKLACKPAGKSTAQVLFSLDESKRKCSFKARGFKTTNINAS